MRMKAGSLSYVLIAVIALSIVVFVGYSTRSVSQKVIDSTATIQQVNTVRFSFKVALLSQQGMIAYQSALATQDEGKLEEALDVFYSAIAFVGISSTIGPDFQKVTQPALEEISSIIEQKGLNANGQDVERVNELVNEIFRISEKSERLKWEEVQRNYVDFAQKEFEFYRFYQLTALVATLSLGIVLVQLYQNKKLLSQVEGKEKQLKYLAYFDSLTGVANQAQLEKLLSEELGRRGDGCLPTIAAMVNIDNLKLVNDLLGRSAGDRVIAEVVRRISQQVKPHGKVARIGGDEFLLLFHNQECETRVLELAESLRRLFTEPVVVSNQSFYITLSIGVARLELCQPLAFHLQELIRHASTAMYRAKKEGKNRTYRYDKVLSNLLEEEHSLAGEIKAGLMREEFELHYQPQFDSVSGDAVGVEALVRWNHPVRGQLNPAEFIEVVEKGFHAKEFGEWVIRTAVLQQQAWKRDGLDIPVSINLSARHILESDFLPSIQRLTSSLNADLSRLHFEITEYELITHKARAFDNLHQLVKAGFSFYLDDFGTGYSSITYLYQLPLLGIKIDKSFIASIGEKRQQQMMVEAIMLIANSMGLKVVAEGVETEEQSGFLTRIGCDYQQGYWHARPLPAGKACELLTQRQTNRV